ncbi:cilia- and flagella-associated protein 157 [Diachasma alloeum]|uniref:cilia- and flagella-associated protein 157 n=1 Tax=Diachasma alloeum TaxID=454923 RepID=UPI0007382635|nr:cilia- and flagella-associated protein 157 [Diachasma alloeum]
MGKKKKKKGGDKEKKAKKKPAANERDIVFYEQQILDNNRQLARLKTRNEFLEGELDSLKAQLTRLEDDRSDVVAHLKRILQQKTEEAKELGERLLAMEELRKDEKLAYKTKEESMLQEYHNMETNLNAEVKLVSGKLNALEDWRNARAELTRKFEIQEEQMAEQEQRHREALYEAEKSLVIGKAQMQREMQERLNDLALSFQEATNLRMADATQRAIRENIALNSELDDTYKIRQELEGKMQICKETEQNTRLRASLLHEELQMALNKVFEQNKFIEKIAEDHLNAVLLRTEERRMEQCASSKDQLLQTITEKQLTADQDARKIERTILETGKQTKDILDDVQVNRIQIEQLTNILHSVKSIITQLPGEIGDITSTPCVACDGNFKRKLLEIYSIIESSNIAKIINV